MVLASKLYRLKPTRLHLVKTPTGPYSRLLRRPWPEVVAMGEGNTIVLLRGTKVVQAIPLWASLQACFYARGVSRGWVVDDFKDQEWAQKYAFADAATVEFLALPAAHIRLANDERVGAIAEALSPWRSEPVERWRRALKCDIWLTLVRVYSFDPVCVKLQDSNRLHAKSRPFRARNIKAVLNDEAWEEAVKNVEVAVEEVRNTTGMKGQTPLPVRPYDMDQVVVETGFPKEELRSYLSLLKRKKQLVFYGSPGTGKTYIAGKIARMMCEPGRGFSEIIQFHPSYAYEDFVQGLRPITRQGRVVYELVDGAFLRFCRQAISVQPAPCVLVIDELNRAPLARVLGELIYLLEYRKETIALASGDQFSIPDNVFIIATMNAADRSIALVDQAIIRRFAFVHMQPNYKILTARLKRSGLDPVPLVELLQEINECIGDRDLLIGISYFMSSEGQLSGDIADIWQYEVEPYLREALYDRPGDFAKYQWVGGVEHRLNEWNS